MTPQLSALKRLFAPLALIGAVTLILSGCVRVDTNLTIKADDTFESTIVLAMTDEGLDALADAMGISREEYLDQMEEAFDPDNGYSSLGDDPEGAIPPKPYQKDGYTGWELATRATSIELLGAGLSEIPGFNNISLVHEDDKFRLSGEVDLTDDAFTGGGLGGAATSRDDAEVSLTFTFPGKVESSTGDASGNSVTFTPKVDEVTTLEAVASAKGSAMALIVWIVGGLALVVVVTLVIVLAVRSSSQKKAAAAPQFVPPATGYPGQVPYPAPQAPQTPPTTPVLQPFTPPEDGQPPVNEPPAQ
jgi:hypothetical protein